jgi:UDP-2-acetamido-2-deoxy-ribo-hexuluronate aminotransferase
LKLTPVLVDVRPRLHLILDVDAMSKKPLLQKRKAIVPVHLIWLNGSQYGRNNANWQKQHNLYVIEDNAQGIGANYTHKDGSKTKDRSYWSCGLHFIFSIQKP